MNRPTCSLDCFAAMAIVIMACLYAVPASAAPTDAHVQVLRFAVEGRADVSKIQLATGRSAKITVAVLSQKISPDHSRTMYQILAQDGSLPTNDTEAVQRLVVIPPENRGKLKLRFETADPAIRQSVAEASSFLTGVISPTWLPRSTIRIHALGPGENRAYASGLGGDASIHLSPGMFNVTTAIHELAHHIEGDHRWILELSKRFIARRARGGSPERLRDLTGLNYEPDEITHRANWTTRGGHHYTGKFYGPSLAQATATEAISMGLERIYSQPDAFYREDSDYFLFLLLTLQSG
jgi:hypothetical protein